MLSTGGGRWSGRSLTSHLTAEVDERMQQLDITISLSPIRRKFQDWDNMTIVSHLDSIIYL